MQIRNILHPTGLGALDEQAFEHALALAVALKCGLTILHVDTRDKKKTDWQQFPSVRSKLIEWMQLAEGAMKSEVKSRLNVDIKKVDARADRPENAVLGYLDRKGADLIVLANGGKEGLQRWLSPSVSEPIARKSQCPCLFVPATSTSGFVSNKNGAVKLKSILAPIAATVPFGQALKFVEEWCSAMNLADVTVTCLHVGKDAPHIPKRARLDVESKTVQGDVSQEIGKEIELHDLVVMVTQGHNSLFDVLRGSMTEQVIRRSTRPVLTLPHSS